VSDEQSLFNMPDGIESRWASPENWHGEKGAGGKELAGRKGSSCFALKAGESKVLAHAEGTSGTVRRMWVTINNRSPKMLRGLRLDMYWGGEEVLPLVPLWVISSGRVSVVVPPLNLLFSPTPKVVVLIAQSPCLSRLP